MLQHPADMLKPVSNRDSPVQFSRYLSNATTSTTRTSTTTTSPESRIDDREPDMLSELQVTKAPGNTTTEGPGVDPRKWSFSTWYLIGLVGLYLLTGLMHPSEFYCLLPGLLYMLFLPASNIFLTIYSVCNITDRSWGKFKAAPWVS